MKRAEWEKMELPMNWEIYKDEYRDRSEDIQEWELDLSAPVEDGVYYVSMEPSSGGDPVSRKIYDEAIPRISGLVVKDGKFDPYTTAHVAYAVTRQFFEKWSNRYRHIPYGEKMDHRYIERLLWNEENECFYVRCGS